MSEPLNDAPTTEKALETLDVLSQVEPEVEETEEVKLVEEETESEPEIELETEEETEKPDEEELELTTPVRRKEILQKYPNLFKDFPYLEKAYYREQQYTEILPSLDDAKVAVEKAETLDNFEKELLGGSAESILKAVKENNQDAYNKLVDNYLPSLAKVDQQAFHHVVGNVIKQTIIGMYQESRTTQNDALANAAVILNQFVFGTSNFAPPSQLAKPESPDKSELQSERQKFIQERFETTRDDLATKVANTLKATIEQNIDPRESMTDYVKKNASRDAMEQLNSLIDKDTRFRAILDKLWEKAFQSNFSKDSVDKIRSAYFSKAKTLLPTVIKQARNSALKGLGKQTDSVDRRGPIPPGKTTTQGSRSPQLKSGMSTLDFFMQD
jgi:hypothetical protein